MAEYAVLVERNAAVAGKVGIKFAQRCDAIAQAAGASGFSWSVRADRQSVNAAFHQLPQRQIDHPLPFDPALADERFAFDAQCKVALAGGVIAPVTTMLFAVVGQLDPGWRKRRIEPGEHFGRHGTGFLDVHWPI